MVQIQKQPMMRRVVYALSPLFLFSIYLYGWRALSIMTVTIVFGCLSEYVMERILKKKKDVKVTEAFLVTSFLFALSMPPSLGESHNLWVVAIGITFGIVFGKMAYGGFGRNVFNPAIAGRLFVFFSFPSILSSGWMIGGMFGLDAIAGVTPLVPLKADILSLMSLGLKDSSIALNMFLGTRAGSLGESSILLIFLGAAYLLWNKTAQLRLMASPLVGAFLTMAGLYYIPGWLGYRPIAGVTNPFYGMMAGSLIFASVFMVTEPVTAPNKPWAQILYGMLIGILIVVIRTFSLLPEGVSFAIVIGNIFASLIDEILPKADMKSKIPDWTIKGLLAVVVVLYTLSSPLFAGKAIVEANKLAILETMAIAVSPVDRPTIDKLYSELKIARYEKEGDHSYKLLGTSDELSETPKEAALIFYQGVNTEGKVYVITFKGEGMWGDIEGLVAVNEDFSHTVGFHVFKHEELSGSAIASGDFEVRFVQGIELANGTVELVKGWNEEKPGQVHAIAGASVKTTMITHKLAESFYHMKRFAAELV